MTIKTHKLQDHNFGDDWKNKSEDRWNYKDFRTDEHWRKDWISFDGIVAHPNNDLVYCGITSFDGDIFWAWNRSTRTWQDCGFSKVGNEYDAKFHRSMELSQDGSTLYCATALLHDVDRYWEAPGGGIFRHDIQNGTTEKLGTPLPHNYIQSIALDEKRGVIYAMHFTPECLSVFDLETQTARHLGPIGSGGGMAQGENILLDDDGSAWCGWGVTRAWQSTPDGTHWTQHPNSPWLARQYHVVAVFDNRMWVMEGYNPENGKRNDDWHSADRVLWEQVPATPWLPRHAASVFVFNDALWVVAGNNISSDCLETSKDLLKN